MKIQQKNPYKYHSLTQKSTPLTPKVLYTTVIPPPGRHIYSLANSELLFEPLSVKRPRLHLKNTRKMAFILCWKFPWSSGHICSVPGIPLCNILAFARQMKMAFSPKNIGWIYACSAAIVLSSTVVDFIVIVAYKKWILWTAESWFFFF